MTINTIKFDPACYLNSEERIAAYLEETLENGTQEDFVKASIKRFPVRNHVLRQF